MIGIGLGVLGTIAVSLMAIVGLLLLIGVPIVLILGSVGGAVRPSRAPEAAGILIGSGMILLYAAIRSATSCTTGNDACGDPNALPLLAAAVAMVGIGAATAIAIYRRRPG